MNENAKKWVAALRSGEFTQGTGWLEKDGKNCCLGVACRLYQKEIGDLEISTQECPNADNYIKFDGLGGQLPAKVQQWLGLNTADGYYDGSNLISENDFGNTFDGIANIIESEPAGLFKEV